MDRQRLLAIGVLLALLLPVAAPAAESSVLFVLDGSGSMQAKVSGRPKIEVARAVMGNLMKSLPADVRVGLETFGHNRKDDCNDIEILVPVGSDHAAVVQAVNNINPKGKTPLTGAIRLAAA
jgi:Ca-activated chloride channel family protein